MKKKWLCIIAFMTCAAVFAFASWKLIEEQREYKAGEDAYTALEEYVSVPTPNPVTPQPTQAQERIEQEPENIEEEDPTIWPVVDFDALREVNPDIVAWIYLEDSVINYPVVQGDDNDYYLSHMFEGSWNGAGTIFLDSRNEGDFSDRHSVIYGHHMQNGSMFAALDDYKRQEFYDTHPTILLITPEKNYKIEMFSAYVASINDEAWELGFTQAGFEAWLTETKGNSCFSSSVTPEATDRIVTLSTCSYEFDNARFVVVGILK